MKLENQVCNLELAQKLKSLGVKQESQFWWHTDKAFIGDDHMYVVSFGATKNPYAIDMYSAFTCSELGEMLPKNIQGRLGMMFLEIYPNAVQNTWYCGYQRVDDAIREEADSEANARAKMLIYLLENKLINTPSQ